LPHPASLLCTSFLSPLPHNSVDSMTSHLQKGGGDRKTSMECIVWSQDSQNRGMSFVPTVACAW
jgi:hypothetical protein